MEARIHVMFSNIPKQEWRDFSAECRRRGDTIVRVLYAAIKEYMKRDIQKEVDELEDILDANFRKMVGNTLIRKGGNK